MFRANTSINTPCFVLFLALTTIGAAAQVNQQLPPSTADAVARRCEQVSSGIEHSDGLAAVCQFSLTLDRHLPNYLCREEIASSLRGESVQNGSRSNVVSVEVRLGEGKETYRDLRINGRPVSGEIKDYVPQQSANEFTSLLAALFSPASGAQFGFAKETHAHGVDALVFNFNVHRATNEALWYLRFGDKVVFPGYHGQIWVDRIHSRLMRIEMNATELDNVPIVSHTVDMEYDDVPLGDGTSFVLPVKSSFENCATPQSCIFNDVTFKNCRKFGANSRVIPAP